MGQIKILSRFNKQQQHTHTPILRLFGLCPRQPGWAIPEGTFRHLLDVLEQNEDNTGRHTNNPDGLPPIQTNWCPPPLPSPPFLRRMPFLTQPSQFILPWDRLRICWLAYPVSLQYFDAVGCVSGTASNALKIQWWDAGMVICGERNANDLHVVQLMPLSPHRLLLQ